MANRIAPNDVGFNSLALTQVIESLASFISRTYEMWGQESAKGRYDHKQARNRNFPGDSEFMVLLQNARQEASDIPGPFLPMAPGPLFENVIACYKDLQEMSRFSDPEKGQLQLEKAKSIVNNLCSLRAAWLATRKPRTTFKSVTVTPVIWDRVDSKPKPKTHEPIPNHVKNWLIARFLADPTPTEIQLSETTKPEPIVLMRFEEFASFLVDARIDLLPNLNNWTDSGLIVDLMVELEESNDANSKPAHSIARLNLPLGRHRCVGIRKAILDAPTTSAESIGTPDHPTLSTQDIERCFDTVLKVLDSAGSLRSHLQSISGGCDTFSTTWTQKVTQLQHLISVPENYVNMSNHDDPHLSWFLANGFEHQLAFLRTLSLSAPPPINGHCLSTYHEAAIEIASQNLSHAFPVSKHELSRDCKILMNRFAAPKLIKQIEHGVKNERKLAIARLIEEATNATKQTESQSGSTKPSANQTTRDPNKPGQDRQKDILAAIRNAGTPLTRPELVAAMRLGAEGKLGANLAWMVNNNILMNIPQRGYWPADEPVPE